jgi:hypothetical protein
LSFDQELIITGVQDTTYLVQMIDGCGSLMATDSVYVTIGNPVNLEVISLGVNQSSQKRQNSVLRQCQ